MSLVDVFEDRQLKKDVEPFDVGDTVKVLVAFLDDDVDFDRVAHVEGFDVLLQLFILKYVDQAHGSFLSS